MPGERVEVDLARLRRLCELAARAEDFSGDLGFTLDVSEGENFARALRIARIDVELDITFSLERSRARMEAGRASAVEGAGRCGCGVATPHTHESGWAPAVRS